MHTPAPWRVGEIEKGFAWINGGDRRPVWLKFAKVAIGMDSESEVSIEGNANLNLILTAPEMLDALTLSTKELKHVLCYNRASNDIRDIIDKIDVVIAKAKTLP